MTDLLRNPARSREIALTTRGHTHGPITRLMSPNDFGRLLKPFVFLDRFGFSADMGSFPPMAMHPHSGIATLTYVAEGGLRAEDSTGADDMVNAGGMEYMQAGSGIWHGGGDGADAFRLPVRGFQLWIALPADQELGASFSLNLDPGDVPMDGPARVLLGAYESAQSRVEAPAPINYLAVTLKAGERWRYQPPAGHEVLWAAIGKGLVATPQPLREGDLAAFTPGQGAVEFEAVADSEFVLGSAVPHPHDLALGYYSVHTSATALRRGEARIREIEQELIAAGRL